VRISLVFFVEGIGVIAQERISVASEDFTSTGWDEGHSISDVDRSRVVPIAHRDLTLRRQMAKRHIVKNDRPKSNQISYMGYL